MTFRNLKAPGMLAVVLLLPALTRGEPVVQSWAQRYNGQAIGNRRAKAMAVDGSDSVIVTGFLVDSAGYSYYATIKYSGAGVPLWTNLYNRPANTGDQAQAIAVDATNGVIVTGYSTGSGNNFDYLTIKYSSDGLPCWTNRYDGPARLEDRATAVAVDSANNVIVTGYSTGLGFNFEYATIKYSGAGAPMWTNRYTGPVSGASEAFAVAVDASGNVLVTGYSMGAVGYDYATIKYSGAGVPMWTNRYDGALHRDDYATAVGVDPGGNVFVTGYSMGAVANDYATLKYSNAGAPLWTNRYTGPGSGGSVATALAVDRTNSVTVTGYSSGAAGYDYATIKYASAGAGLGIWTNRYGGAGLQNDGANAVAVDGSGNAFVTGYSTVSGIIYDYVTVGYASNGVPLWTNRYNGPANGEDQATAVAVDHSGNIVVTGYSAGAGPAYDYATIKYAYVFSPPVAGFIANVTTGTVPLQVVFTNLSTGATNYGWAFGDGNLSANLQPTNTYTSPGTYSVTLSAVGPGGTNTLTRTNYIVVVPLPPAAGFSANVTTGVAPLTVVFTNLSAGTTNYSWAFGDGNLSTNVQPANTYTNAGTYSVTLSAVGLGGTNTLTRTNYIVVVPPPPVASFAADRTTGVAPLTVVFTNLSTGATNYGWAFGDGNLSTKAQPANTYINPGTYSVTLSAVGLGGTNILTRANYIVVVPLVPLMTGLNLTNGTFQLRVDNVLQPGTLVIEARTNLSPRLAVWSPVYTNTKPTNVVYYSDTNAGNYVRQFYRAFQHP